jgi:hypothetical protein
MMSAVLLLFKHRAHAYNDTMNESLVDVAVLVIFFNRPSCLEKTFDSIRKARPSRLYLYQDGPRGEKDIAGILACRELVSHIDWKCQVKTFYQTKNMGVDPSEYIAIKWAFFFEQQCIVVEDDDCADPSFFPFCQALLERYKDDPKVGEISGLTYGEKSSLASQYDYAFTHFGCIWGWASWKRVIDQWDPLYLWLDDPQSLSALRKWYGKKKANSVISLAQEKRAKKNAYYEIINGVNCVFHDYVNIFPTQNMIHNTGLLLGAHTEVTDLDILPASTRRLYTMATHDVPIPLRCPPDYLIDKQQEKRSLYRPHFWAKVMSTVRCIFKGKWKLVSNKIHSYLKKKKGK